jgi:hypothetical protein
VQGKFELFSAAAELCGHVVEAKFERQTLVSAARSYFAVPI